MDAAIAHEREQSRAEYGQLSSSHVELQQKVSELEKRLDENSISRIMATPWQHVAGGMFILLIGIFLGIWGCRTSQRLSG